MDLLSVINNVNLEMGELRRRTEGVITDRERAELLNSVATVLADGLVDLLRFSVRDRISESVRTSWEYDMSDKAYIRRRGPTLEQIVKDIEGRKSAFLDSEVTWSRDARVRDQASFERIIASTIWDSEGRAKRQPAPVPVQSQGQEPTPQIKILKVDVRVAERELDHLSSKTRLLDRKRSHSLVASLSELMKAGYLLGVSLIIQGANRVPLAEWRYVRGPDSTLQREGKSVDEVVDVYKDAGDKLELIATPIWTNQFAELPSASRKSAVRGTYWERDLLD